MSTASEIKNPVKQWLAKNRMTHQQFADEIGWTQAFTTDFLNGKHPDIKVLTFNKILVLTGLKYETVLRWLQKVAESKETN